MVQKNGLKKPLIMPPNESPTVLEHYGDILFQLGQVDQAIEQWNKALKLGSKSEFLEKKIADKKLYE